uniref:Lunapark, ER junction formation factor n=1 Tax=Rousettus aegyptiacus TaxID=9407 RepID=A0A7J8JH49_ROUAE|nr:lunapark, ER junction formation factor [Rousettus aegyptiacus]
MGGVFSRWRTKPSTVEVLENIDKEIQALEEFREKNQRLQKLWVGRLILYSSILYLFTCLIVYLWYLPDEFIARLAMTLPFFAFPLIIWSIRTVLIFFFSKRTERNNEALDDLKSQKKKILEEVMEKETYKTAKLILERFDPESKKAKEFEPPSAGAAVTARPGQEIRQRTAAQRNLSPTPASSSQGPPPQVPVSPGPPKDTSAPGGPPERAVTPALSSNMLPRLSEFSFEKRQAVEGLSSIGPLPSGSVISSENQISEESLEEQDSLDNSTEQTEDNISETEQTNQVIEKASGMEELEKQEETDNEEETLKNEAKSTVPKADSTPNPELSGESLMAM